MSSLKEKRQGFTIVELIIVIVVIGVLAAITMVSYNSIQDRARETRVVAAVDAYEKLLRIYKAQYGEYPAITNPGAIACMGNIEDYPVRNGFSSGVCVQQAGFEVRVDNSFNAELQKVSSGRLPDASFPVQTLSEGGSSLDMRGVYAFADGNRIEALVYVAKNDGNPCGGRFRTSHDGVPPDLKACELYLE